MHETELMAASQRFTKNATLLSEGIERAEAFLLTLTGRVVSSTEIDKGVYLEWKRFESEWRIVYRVGDKEALLTKQPVATKACAAKHLSCLYEDILRRIAEKTDEVLVGLGALEEFFNPPPIDSHEPLED